MSLAGEGDDGKPGLIDALEIMIENLRKECYARFASSEDFDKLKHKVKK